MKKAFYLLMLCLLLVGCGSSADAGKTNLTMDSFTEVFEGKGIEIDSDEKPMFSMIGAKDGVIFYNEGQVVKIYEFDSQKDIKSAEEALPAAKDWDRQGLFLLETSDEESKKIFNSVK